MRNLVSLIAGTLFGFGLALAQMTNPAKIINFLDVAGTWDPSLAFVMGGALFVSLISFRFILRQPRPAFEQSFHLPSRSDINPRLVAGAVLFGIGWGLGGFCPGPGIAALVSGHWQPVVFVLGLVGGSLAFQRQEQQAMA